MQTGLRFDGAILLAVAFFLGAGFFKSRCLPGQLEFRSLAEILNIIVEVIGTWKCLTTDAYLASCHQATAKSRCQCNTNKPICFVLGNHYWKTPFLRPAETYIHSDSSNPRNNRHKLYRLPDRTTLNHLEKKPVQVRFLVFQPSPTKTSWLIFFAWTNSFAKIGSGQGMKMSI